MNDGRHAADPDRPAWYLAQVKPNGDALAERNLLRQGFGVFAPKLARTRRHAGRFREELSALFPGYLFVEVPASAGRWRAIASTLGVQRLVTLGGESPSRVSETLIDDLRQRCGEDGRVRLPTPAKGDRVKVVSGPFADLIGRIAEIPSGRRVWILLDLLGRERRIALERRQVALQLS